MMITKIPEDIQIVAHTNSLCYGEELKEGLLDRGIDTIERGVALVCRFGKIYIIFEVGVDIRLHLSNGASLITGLPGSRIIIDSDGNKISVSDSIQNAAMKKLLFLRDCRLPTHEEYLKYLRIATV